MNKIFVVALTAASCVLSSTAVLAASVTDYQGGVLLGSWTQSLTPVVDFSVPGQYTEVAISNGTGAAFGYTDAFWYSAADHGGLVVGDPLLSPINTGGAQSYVGTEVAPVFIPGVYHESDGSIVTISVPEPATWAMMLVGMGMIGFAARRRRNVSVSYA